MTSRSWPRPKTPGMRFAFATILRSRGGPFIIEIAPWALTSKNKKNQLRVDCQSILAKIVGYPLKNIFSSEIDFH